MVFPLIPTLQLAFSLLMDFLQINFLLRHTGVFDLQPSNQLCAVVQMKQFVATMP